MRKPPLSITALRVNPIRAFRPNKAAGTNLRLLIYLIKENIPLSILTLIALSILFYFFILSTISSYSNPHSRAYRRFNGNSYQRGGGAF